ncbi:hypothetical protein ACFPRL_06035 [Pseudoclavibacter helvolus]
MPRGERQPKTRIHPRRARRDTGFHGRRARWDGRGIARATRQRSAGDAGPCACSQRPVDGRGTSPAPRLARRGPQGGAGPRGRHGRSRRVRGVPPARRRRDRASHRPVHRARLPRRPPPRRARRAQVTRQEAVGDSGSRAGAP